MRPKAVLSGYSCSSLKRIEFGLPVRDVCSGIVHVGDDIDFLTSYNFATGRYDVRTLMGDRFLQT